MRFGGIVLAALLILGACTSDPQPKEPKPSATTATPTATPPTMPAQAEQDTPEGAAAFVKHYIDVFNYAASTGDVKELSRLSSPTCEGCQSYIKLYRDTYAAGGYFKDGDWTASKFELELGSSAIDVFVRVKATPGTRRDSSSSAVQPGDAEDIDLVFRVGRRSQTRMVERIGRSDG